MKRFHQPTYGGTWIAFGAVLLALALSGCSSSELETTYGRRTGTGAQSINGTSVLGEMFAAAGHQVESRQVLSPGLMSANTIVWFPNDFAEPSKAARDWLVTWLTQEGARTLVFVGRDFDAEPLYWKKVLPLLSGARKDQAETRLKAAQASFDISRSQLELAPGEQWFAYDGKLRRRDVRTLEGFWAEGIEPAKVEIELNGRLPPPAVAEALLESEGDDVARREFLSFYPGQIIVIANGSFLLNLPLVNHEHRKLAGRLIDEVGEPGRVVFLQSNSEPQVLDKEPSPHMGTGLELFAVWPIGPILLQLAALGIIFCFSRFPIFGTPGRLPTESNSDFGKHIDALGRLLRRTADRAYAENKLRQYHAVKSDG